MPPERLRPLLILLLGSLSAMGPLSIDLYLPGLPGLTRDLGTTPALGQLTLTACLLGLAAGQLVSGPLSDALGRRRPLVVGMALYALASAGCALAPTVGVLAILRLLQGLAGAAGIVIARSMVRDLRSGDAAARLFAALLLVNGLAPILAPTIGSRLLAVTSWRGLFAVLTGVGVLLTLGVLAAVPESLPPERRRTGGLRATFAALAGVLADRTFAGYAVCMGLVFAAMFAYIAGATFVLQEVYGLSPQQFALVFAANAVGIVSAGQLARGLIGWLPTQRVLAGGVSLTVAGALGLLVAVLAGAGLAGVLPALFAMVASIGLVLPSATALALEAHGRAAGSASGVLGVIQFAFGAAAAPLVGLGGTASALPMAIVCSVLAVAAAAALALPARTARDPAPR